jgi:hypothetical protein
MQIPTLWLIVFFAEVASICETKMQKIQLLAKTKIQRKSKKMQVAPCLKQ